MIMNPLMKELSPIVFIKYAERISITGHHHYIILRLHNVYIFDYLILIVFLIFSIFLLCICTWMTIGILFDKDIIIGPLFISSLINQVRLYLHL